MCSSVHTLSEHYHYSFAFLLAGDLPQAGWFLLKGGASSLCHKEALSLQLEASLRSYLTHLGHIIVSKEI